MFVKFRQNFIKISKKNTKFHAFFIKFWMNNLFKLFKNDKIVTTFLLKFWDLSGAKVWESCRSRKSWKNEYLVAIVAVDTAENGPPKVWRNWIIYSVVSLLALHFSPDVDARWRVGCAAGCAAGWSQCSVGCTGDSAGHSGNIVAYPSENGHQWSSCF